MRWHLPRTRRKHANWNVVLITLISVRIAIIVIVIGEFEAAKTEEGMMAR